MGKIHEMANYYGHIVNHYVVVFLVRQGPLGSCSTEIGCIHADMVCTCCLCRGRKQSTNVYCTNFLQSRRAKMSKSIEKYDLTLFASFLRDAKPGGFQTRVFPTFFGKGPDCVADPFGTVPQENPRTIPEQIGKIQKKIGKVPKRTKKEGQVQIGKPPPFETPPV